MKRLFLEKIFLIELISTNGGIRPGGGGGGGIHSLRALVVDIIGN